MQRLVFLLAVLIIRGVRPCVFWSFPDDEPDPCCEEKQVGNHFYKFVKRDVQALNTCGWDCVYTRVDQLNSQYCFRDGGSDTPDCAVGIVEWKNDMQPAQRCVSPGSKVLFQWPSGQCQNVNQLSEKEYGNCSVVNETCANDGTIDTLTKPGKFYFASGRNNGMDCRNGKKAVIKVSDNCTCSSANIHNQQIQAQDVINDILGKLKSETTGTNVVVYLKKYFKVNRDFFSPEQQLVFINAPSCSDLRTKCDECFRALNDIFYACFFPQFTSGEFSFLTEKGCDSLKGPTNTTCRSCMCEISKTCDPTTPCSKYNPIDTPSTTTTTTPTSSANENNVHPCNRDCSTSLPKQCVFNLTLKMQSTDSDGRRADGRTRDVLTYNGHLPGPPIIICEGDELVVNLTNGLQFEATTLHFHGIREKTRPWRDGVPCVTQCPIPPGDTFQYGFIAKEYDNAPTGTYTQSGTYWYHSHVGDQRTNGAYGALIIRPNTTDLPYDDENLIILQEWYDGMTVDQNRKISSVLINGNSKSENTSTTKYTEFMVEPGQKCLFRVIGAISEDVPLRLSIENHTFTAIAADSQDIQHVVKLTDLWLTGGERFDIVVHTKENYRQDLAYKIRVSGYADPNTNRAGPYCTIAWLKYGNQSIDSTYFANCSSSEFNPTSSHKTLNPVLNKNSVLNKTENIYDSYSFKGGNIYIKDLRAAKKKSSLIFWHENAIVQTNLNTQYLELNKLTFNNFTMQYPDIPFLLQNHKTDTNLCGTECNVTVHPLLYANQAEKVKYVTTNCSQIPHKCPTGKDCNKCQHVLQEPYAPGYWAEIVLINNDADTHAHPIHLHGGWFWVLGMGNFGKNINQDIINKKDGQNHTNLHRNFNFPPAKDTIQVPPGGYVILRIPLDNRGVWIMHCHINRHVVRGMAMVLQVGGFGQDRSINQDWCYGNLKIDQKCAYPCPVK